MKLKTGEVNGKPIFETVTWGDHYPGCVKCREVDLDKSSSFVNACAQGSVLINEEMVKRQYPIVAAKRAEVLAWAKKAGVFKIP